MKTSFDSAFLLDLGLKPNAVARLARFSADLLRFNRAANLVSRRDPDHQVWALLRECVEVGLWLHEQDLPSGPWVDVGSGGGFPGLVLGILEPERELVLIERRRGRCDFLRREVGVLGLDQVQVKEADARSLADEDGWSRFVLVSLKAVASPGQALALAAPLLTPRGRALLFQRPDWKPDSGESGRSWRIGPAWRGRGLLGDQAAFLLERVSA